jgi:hypothetical protein
MRGQKHCLLPPPSEIFARPPQVFGGGLLVDGAGAVADLEGVSFSGATYAAVHAHAGGRARLAGCRIDGGWVTLWNRPDPFIRTPPVHI